MEKEGPQAASMSQGSGDLLEKYVRFCGDTYRMDKVVKAVRSVQMLSTLPDSPAFLRVLRVFLTALLLCVIVVAGGGAVRCV